MIWNGTYSTYYALFRRDMSTFRYPWTPYGGDAKGPPDQVRRYTINPVDSTDPYTQNQKIACAHFEISRRSKLPSQTIDISGLDQQETRPPLFDHLNWVLKLSILTFVSLFAILECRHEAFWISCGAIRKNKLWRIRARSQLSQVHSLDFNTRWTPGKTHELPNLVIYDKS